MNAVAGAVGWTVIICSGLLIMVMVAAAVWSWVDERRRSRRIVQGAERLLRREEDV